MHTTPSELFSRPLMTSGCFVFRCQCGNAVGGLNSSRNSSAGLGVNERRSDKVGVASHLYTNFVPTGSANDSEIQSLSSDTHTDDSASLADYSTTHSMSVH